MRKSIGFWVVVLLSIVSLAPVIIFGLFRIWLFVGYQTAWYRDHRAGTPLTLQNPGSIASPDGKKRFITTADGLLTIVDANTGLAIQKRRVSPEEYNRVEAVWLDEERLRVIGNLRYPAMALNRSYRWNSKTGDWSAE